MNSIIVGGGITGLCAARICQKNNESICLVEKEPTFGGLFRSEQNELGHVFDQGTHFVQPTSIEEVNKIMFEDLVDDDCFIWTESLREGGFFNGRLTVENGCLDTRSLPREIYYKGMLEMLGLHSDSVTGNLEDYLLKNYGPAFTENIFRPVLKKLSGLSLRELHTDSLSQFLLQRLLVFDRPTSKLLKQIPQYDQKISWAHRDDGESFIKKRYPKVNGVGRWAEGLQKRIEKEGGKLFPSNQIISMEWEGSRINKIHLFGGQKISCDRLIWTGSPVGFLKLQNKVPSVPKPEFRKVVLMHFSIDTAINTNLQWVTCYDPSMLTFRVTLYPNIAKGKTKPPPHHLTVEILIEEYDLDQLKGKIFEELKFMGIIKPTTCILEFRSKEISPGWPIFTYGHRENSDKLLEQAEKLAENVVFLGRSKGRVQQFSDTVIEELFIKLNNEFPSRQSPNLPFGNNR